MVLSGRRFHALSLRCPWQRQPADGGFSLLETIVALLVTALIVAVGVSALGFSARLYQRALVSSATMRQMWILDHSVGDDMRGASEYRFSGSSLWITCGDGTVYSYHLSISSGLVVRSVNGYGAAVVATNVQTLGYAMLAAGGVEVNVVVRMDGQTVAETFAALFAQGRNG